MASHFFLTLDTTAPKGVSILLNGGAATAKTTQLTLTVTHGDASSDGYEMRIWGVEGAEEKADAQWEPYAQTKTIRLPAVNGSHTVSLMLRDDAKNESDTVTASITLDLPVPVVTVTAPDRARLELGADCAAVFSFSCSTDFSEYQVRVVDSREALVTDGVALGTDNGSVNVSGSGSFAKGESIPVTVHGLDLAAASGGAGVKRLKVFVKSTENVWSVI